MMNNNKNMSATPFVTVCNEETSSDNQEKMKYEKPEVSVVKFMFENEITWGSFESGLDGDNGGEPASNWWD